MWQGIASLMHCVLVSQDERRVEVYSREGPDWRLRVLTGAGARLDLPALGVAPALDDLYEGAEPPT